jgi:RNA polymerase sigma factor (sigma-70 family)
MKNPGITNTDFGTMKTREPDRPLEADALRDVERVLRGRLRAYGLSVAFIERTVEDATQKAWEELLRARADGEAIENPSGFVVRAGFFRAMDELRREGRRADGTVLEAIIDNGATGGATEEPSTDELAIAYVEAEQLRGAVARLSPEEQQVLSLHYFEEMTTEASAAALYCSERTYRRRLKRALRKLGRILGAPVPEPGSELAIEIGVITWIALRGAKVALAHGAIDQLAGVVQGIHDRLAWLADCARDLLGRTGSSGGSERIVALASSGPGKAVGTCLAACLLAVGGVELAGVGRDTGSVKPQDRPAAEQPATNGDHTSKPQPITAPPVPVPPATTESSARNSTASAPEASASKAEKREREATAAVRTQSPEAVASPEPASEPAPEATSQPSASEQSPTELAGSQGLESAAP